MGESMILQTYARKYNSNTIQAFNIPNKVLLLQNSIRGLASQEGQLYATIHESTYEGFMAKLRQIFSETPGVKAALRNFKKGNLVTSLDLPQNISLSDTEISITLDPGKDYDLYQIFKLLKGGNKDFEFDIQSQHIILTFQYNSYNVKTLINEMEERTKRNRFKTGAASMTDVNKEFRKLVESGEIGQVVINRKTKPIVLTENLKTASSTGFRQNFSYNKETIAEALKDPKLKTDLMMARSRVYLKLLSFCNGISDLELAFKKAWTEKMGDIDSDSSLSQFLFLSKGGNLSAGVSGAVQELYGAIIAEYVALQVPKTNQKIANIVGNIIQGNTEQPKTDLQILGTIGIQVKAYSMDNSIKQMGTNIHPDALQTNLQPFGINNIADTIVQAVFNSTNGDYHSLESKLEPALTQLMNFDTGHQIEDRVCFYLVDAQFLVPGSEIIRSLIGDKSNQLKISIRNSYKPKYGAQSDSAFNHETHTGKDGGNSPNFTAYFKGKNLDVTDYNEEVYDLLESKQISIDVDFDYSFMGIRRYSIF